jgi:hypothetical protein
LAKEYKMNKIESLLGPGAESQKMLSEYKSMIRVLPDEFDLGKMKKLK